jgi:hypothetical protein
MQMIYGRNMHEVIPQGLELLFDEGQPKRHMTEITSPVALMMTEPMERLSRGTEYDLNPFVALFTSLWVLGGRNDVTFLAKFDGYQGGTSDDGKILHGAYGQRMRAHFDPGMDYQAGTIDQLKSVVHMLRNNPGHKAAVISLWDAGEDFGSTSRNLPAATHLYLSINHAQRLDMMVVYRDADIFDMRLDAIVFSMMQEFIAKAISVPIGRMTIVANCLGAETKVLDLIKNSFHKLPPSNPYPPLAVLVPIATIDSDAWLGELSMFLDEGPVMGMRDPFFRHVAAPMWQVWDQYKSTAGLNMDGARKALDTVSLVRASDWQGAANEWLLRRIDDRT